MAIYVTKSFLPPREEYNKILDNIWESGILTNQGACVQELQAKMCEFMGVQNFHYVANGTIALQLALDALGIKSGEIITTPFSYVATIGSIMWERCQPKFVDIKPNSFTIDSDKIETVITKDTKAIMPVHVFGYPCEVEKIQAIAEKYNLKVIYDGAHAFGVKYKNKSLLSYGDISTVSFHATKLFHTVEGGGCIIKDSEISKKLDLAMRFGHNSDTHYQLGINGKQSEFHAAMGLVNLSYIQKIIADRKRTSEIYDVMLGTVLERPQSMRDLEYNYAYYPVLFKTEADLLKVFSALAQHKIYPRRYFWPSLNKLSYINNAAECQISEGIASRIACLPLYFGIEDKIVETISKIIKDNVRRTSFRQI